MIIKNFSDITKYLSIPAKYHSVFLDKTAKFTDLENFVIGKNRQTTPLQVEKNYMCKVWL